MAGLRPGSEARVVGIFFERHGNTCFGQFHEGAIYTIEFEDGVAADVHESQLEPMVPIGNSAWSLLC